MYANLEFKQLGELNKCLKSGLFRKAKCKGRVLSYRIFGDVMRRVSRVESRVGVGLMVLYCQRQAKKRKVRCKMTSRAQYFYMRRIHLLLIVFRIALCSLICSLALRVSAPRPGDVSRPYVGGLRFQAPLLSRLLGRRAFTHVDLRCGFHISAGIT